MDVDILVFAAHPDDAELSMGGTIAKFTSNKFKVGIIDLSRGEMGTRGSAEIRKEEAGNASRILGLTVRENLGFKDGSLKFSDEYLKKVIIQIRKYRPAVLFAPYYNDRHPDHTGTSQLIKEAMFFSGLNKIKTKENGKVQKPFRPGKLFYYMQTYEFDPSFIVDISGTFKIKMKAVNAYGTQFYNPESKEPETFISQQNFVKYLEARAKVYGFKIGKDYGEAFFCEEEIEMDIRSIINNGGKK